MLTLIAEDDEALRLLLTDFFEGLGHTVKSAENGMDLVKFALAERPDLIATDLHMPQMTGDSMIAMIDMYPDLAGIPVIVITGATEAELADMGLPKEIPILSKPFDFAKITTEVEKLTK